MPFISSLCTSLSNGQSYKTLFSILNILSFCWLLYYLDICYFSRYVILYSFVCVSFIQSNNSFILVSNLLWILFWTYLYLPFLIFLFLHLLVSNMFFKTLLFAPCHNAPFPNLPKSTYISVLYVFHFQDCSLQWQS